MPEGGGLLVDRAAEVELVHDPAGGQFEVRPHQLRDAGLVDASRPFGVDHHRHGVRHANRDRLLSELQELLPVVPIVLIFGGFVLPVPAAAITAAYAILVAAIVNRDLPRGERLVEVLTECGLLVGGVLLILGTAMGLTNLLITEHVPDRLTVWMSAAINSPWIFLLIMNLVMVVLGCVIEIFSAIIVVAPLIVPVARAVGVDPVHLGVIMLASLELGYLMPPIGLNLLMSASRFRRSMFEVASATLPMLAVLAAGVALINLFPQLSLWLPHWFAGSVP